MRGKNISVRSLVEDKV